MTVTAESPARSDPDYVFDFCGGQLAIDFTNTVGSRGGEPEEHLQTFGDLLAWAEARGIPTINGYSGQLPPGWERQSQYQRIRLSGVHGG